MRPYPGHNRRHQSASPLPPLLVLYLLQGIAVVHGVVNRAKLAQGWLVGLYVVLLLLPQTLLLLSLLGAVDAWVDIRARIAARLEPSNHLRS